MKKKYAFIFLGLGLLLLILYVLYDNTDIIKNNDSSNDNLEIAYDYVKSFDLNKKTKISFPKIDGLSLMEYSSDGFSKIYSNSDNTKLLMASVYSDNDSIEKLVEKQLSSFKMSYEANGERVTDDTITCSYSCHRYRSYKADNSLHADELVILYKVTSNEIFNLTYHAEKIELSQEEIDNIVNNIKISNDAEYSNSSVTGDKLTVKMNLRDNKIIEIVFDSKVYEEVISGSNNIRSTELKNVENETSVVLSVKLKTPIRELLEDIDLYFDSTNRYERENEKYTVYGYELGESTAYAIMIDDETALLVNTRNGALELNDFLNFTIKDAN